jgi:DNA-binding transcriptional MerR regulator
MLLTRSQGIHIEYYQQITGSDQYAEAITYLRERKFTKKDVGISYRELNHWSTKDILFENNESGKWRKYNILELIWLELIKEFRQYNLPLDTISKIKNSAILPFDVTSLIQENKEQIQEVIMQSFKKKDKEYQEFLKSEEYQIMFNSIIDELPNYNTFEIILLEAYFLKLQYRIVVNLKGDVIFSNELYISELNESDYFNSNFEKSNLSVSINRIISNIFKNYNNKELKYKWKLISEQEENILEVLRSDKKLKSINIRFNKDSEINLLEYTEEMKILPKDYLKKIIISGGYQDIKIITQNGDIVLCERTVKQKIK